MQSYKGYELTVGLEVHVELKTESKIFCSCSTAFGAPPNTQCCPVCTGMPGALPVLNRQVVDYAIKAGLALDCEIGTHSGQDRKNYFYPDLPKAYQISQYKRPLCSNGRLTFGGQGEEKTVQITRIHIEEDAGKLIHKEDGSTLIDCNRCGVHLIEIVTEPQIHSAEDAKEFLQKLRTLMLYTEVSDCKMNEGSMRCDVNLSVRKEGQPLGQRTEIKNLNSFAFVMKAIDYEYKRQVDVIEGGGCIQQETLRFEEESGRTLSMRKKENAPDYRFFPDPDLPPVVLTKERIEEIRCTLPVLPDERMAVYRERYGLSFADAQRLTAQRARADYFEEAAGHTTAYQILANLLNEESAQDTPRVTPFQLAQLATLLQEGTINSATARRVLLELCGKEDVLVKDYVMNRGLCQINDTDVLTELVKQALLESPRAVTDYRNGKKKAAMVIVGAVMKKTAGKANAPIVENLVLSLLEEQ